MGPKERPKSWEGDYESEVEYERWRKKRRLGRAVDFFTVVFSVGSEAKESGDVFPIRKVKQNLAIVIAVNLLIGIAMIVIGATNLLHRRLSYDKTPVGMWYIQDYILLTAVGAVYFLVSCFGYAGICESKNTFAKCYMLASISFGFGLLQIFVIWISTLDFLVPDEMQTHEYTHEYYFIAILLASIFQLACGFFSYIISLNYVHARGYYSINEEEAELADFFEAMQKREEQMARKEALGRRLTT